MEHLPRCSQGSDVVLKGKIEHALKEKVNRQVAFDDLTMVVAANWERGGNASPECGPRVAHLVSKDR